MQREKEARKYLRNRKYGDAVDSFNEAAHEYDKQGKSEKAIEILEEAINIAKEHQKLFEASLCERFLSEVHADLGNREACLRHLTAFRRLSIDCGSKSQEQLSYIVEAWCLQQLFITENADRLDLEEAIRKVKKSREIVEKYKKSFKPSEPGGLPFARTANTYIIEAQLYNQLEENAKGLQLLEKANSLLKNSNEKTLRFELLRTKCSMSPVEKRIDIAEYMDEEAPDDKKAFTLCELSHQYVLGNRLVRGYKALTQAVFLHEKQFSPMEREETEKRLCILYRLVKYSKIIENPRREPKISQCELYEAVGDLYDKYFQTMLLKERKDYKHFVRENILKNYEKTVEHKRNDGDALRAYQGMALVYLELEDFVRSKRCCEQRLEILKATRAPEEKILDTRVTIFNCMCKLEYSNLEATFEELKEQITRDDTKRELFENYANYWSDQGNRENAQKWREEADAIPDVFIKNEDDETDVLFFRLSNEDILEKCKDESHMLKLESLTEHQLQKTNDKGETILHQAAMKSDNEAVVEKLCKLGCDVNAKDFGGWTPLSEAVSNNEFGNAQVLIRYGANVNLRSSQPFVSEESQNSSDELNHTGVTPLMDACTNGFIDIAQLLIDNKARIDLKDSSHWTAYHHLKRYMDDNTPDQKMIKFAEILKNLTANCTSLPEIPPCPIRTTRHSIVREDSPPDEEEDEMILGKAASRKRRNSNSSENRGTVLKRKFGSGGPGPISFRSSPSPKPTSSSPSARPTPKRTSQPLMTAFCQPKQLKRQNSSSSLTSRRSLSPNRSLSPATVRSAPSVYGGRDDEIQVVGFRRSGGKADHSPSPRVLQPVLPAQRQQLNQSSSDIVVKFCFESSTGDASEEIRPVKIPMSRTSSMEELKERAKTINPSIGKLKIKNIWDKDDKDKAELGDSMLLSHISSDSQREISLVFQLSAPLPHEIYEEYSENPIEEVTNRLKCLSTEKHLDLTNLFLDSKENSEWMSVFEKSERPQDSRIVIGFCELSTEDETNLQYLLNECSELSITSVITKDGFRVMFENPKTRLTKLEIIGATFQGESRIIRILENSPNLTALTLSGIQMVSNLISDIPSVMHRFSHLVKLDLSFNSSWITDQLWKQILSGFKNLEELTMNETKTDVQFECDWLPKLTSFIARGSDLHWDSLFELFSVMERITQIDIRYSTVDSSLTEELQLVKQITEILY